MKDIRRIRSRLLIVAILVAGTFASAARAHSPTPSVTSFDHGIAAFTAGDNVSAAQYFESAIRENASDPRSYYLRAVCLTRLGHVADARNALAAGAQWEARQPDRFAVTEVLRNLPKRDREQIEVYRYRARIGEPLDLATLNATPVGSNVAVLRTKVSIPLDQLVEPVGLTEWLESSSHSAEMASLPGESHPFQQADSFGEEQLPGPFDSPFVDDPEPAIEVTATVVEEVVPAEFVDDESSSKIPAGELVGILGRVLGRTAPLPSLDGVRDQIPGWAGAGPEAGDDPFDAAPAEMGFSPAQPADAADFDEEDPFGGF